MLNLIKNNFIKVLIIIAVSLSGNSFASTICALDCPSTGGGSGGGALPQITEIFPTDGSDLLLDTSGLIILDSDIYNNLLNLTINPSTTVYIGQSSLPSNDALPDTLELFTITYTGGLSITGLASDYVLLQHFNGNTALNLTAANGILVIDTNTLTSVPLPGAIIFMFSGIALLFTQAFRKRI